MGRINDKQDIQDHKEASGMDATSYPSNIPPGFVELARNLVLNRSSGYTKRSGSTNVLATALGHAITAGVTWYKPNGQREVIVSGGGAATALDEALAGTSLSLGWNAAARVAFAQPGIYPFLFNGTDSPRVWTGTTLRPIGLAAPGTEPALTAGTPTGSLVDGGSYAYAYTYVIESATGHVVAESSPSPINAFVATSARAINVGYTDGVAPTTHVYIYRTFTSSAQAFLLARIAIGVGTSYADSFADIALQNRALELDNGQLSDYTSQARFPAVVANRVFVVSADNEIRHSKIGQSGAVYESFRATAFVPTSGIAGTSDSIVGLGGAGDTPIVLKERSVGALDAIGVPDYGGGDPVLYAYRELTTGVGGLSHWAQCSVFGELLWLSNAGIFATDGRTVRDVAPSLSALFAAVTLTPAQVGKVSAFNDVRNRSVYFTFYQSLGDSTPTRVLVGDYRRYPDFRWTVWEPGETPATLPGVRPGCFIGVPSLTREAVDVWAGDSRATGRLLQLNTGVTDIDNVANVARSIEMRLRTRAYDFGSPVNEKLFKGGLITARLEGGSILAYTLADLGAPVQVQSFTLGGDLLYWDVSLWDTGPWGINPSKLYEYKAHIKGRIFQMELVHVDDAICALQGWSVFSSGFGAY